MAEEEQMNFYEKSTCGKCFHECHDMKMATAKEPELLPLSHFDELLHRQECDKQQMPTALAFSAGLNNAFLQRLQDIEQHAQNNLQLKIITYQEWVEALLHINDTMFSSKLDLESKIDKRLELEAQENNVTETRQAMQKLLAEHNPLAKQLADARHDINRLLTVLRCAYHYNTWNISGLSFETIDPNDIFKLDREEKINTSAASSKDNVGIKNGADHLELGRLHIRALAWEVADKHDEIRELKKQITSLEEEIQNAQKKIQLKDDVIKELRADLKGGAFKVLKVILKSISNTVKIFFKNFLFM